MARTAATAGKAQHSKPKFSIVGRIAADGIGKISWPGPPSLHLSFVISDGYSGLTIIDGQPTMLEAGLRNFMQIRANFQSYMPSQIVAYIPIAPPTGVSPQDFARQIMARAQAFASYTGSYSAPESVRGSRMKPGEYNSGSFLSGLIRSVTGTVPMIVTPGYQAPGWESPMPEHFFKGEAVR